MDTAEVFMNGSSQEVRPPKGTDLTIGREPYPPWSKEIGI